MQRYRNFADFESRLGVPLCAGRQVEVVEFYINGVKHTMPGSYGVYGRIDANTCFGGVQNNEGRGYSIMGDVFLKSRYVVFDVATPRIGFAQQAGVNV
jgi:hypothetical protein